MRVWPILLLALVAGRPPESLEQKFVAALRRDLASGKAEQTLSMIAPEAKQVLSAARLSPVYAQWKKYGAVKSIVRDAKTPFALTKQVRFLLVQEKQETHVLVVFNIDGGIISYWFRPGPPKWTIQEIRAICEKWKGAPR